jgi:type VI secretion system protein ImpG
MPDGANCAPASVSYKAFGVAGAKPVLRGLSVRRTRTSFFLSQQWFGPEGELYSFGTVLSRFFSPYTSINTFYQLDMVSMDNQERYT